MKIERTKNAVRNIIFGIILQIFQLLCPFIIRTVMINFLGVEYLGLNSLFVSILQVLNLAELGVGTAMVYSMYEPIAKDNQKKICALMKLYRFYYRLIGIVVATLGLILFPFIPKLIKGNVPQDVSVYILYLLHLATTVLSYWLFSYKNCLLAAHQRVDISSKISLIIYIIQYGFQFMALCLFRNYYLFLIIALFSQVLNNIITAIIVTKMYPDYKPIGNLESGDIKDINAKIRDLFTGKIGGVIVNSADTIVISAYLGLTILAIYQNYFYILTALITTFSIIFKACMAGIGNSIIIETKAKNYRDLRKFTFIVVWISGFCTCSLLCLFQPFMRIWVGKEYMFEFSAVICFCIYFFIYEINQLFNLYKDSAGLWHEDRFRPLVTALSNLTMNLIMVQFWGIYGVLLSTVLSTLFVGMPWLLKNLFTVLFDNKQLKDYLKQLLFYIITTVLVCSLVFMICSCINFNDWLTFIFRGLICCIVSNLLLFLIYKNKWEFEESIRMVDGITKNRFLIEKKLRRFMSNNRK